MDSIYELITSDVRPGDEIVLNVAETVGIDGGMFALVDRLKGGGYKVIEEGREAVVLRLVGDESKDEFDIPPRDNLRVESEATSSPTEEPDFRGSAAGPESSLPPEANWIWAEETRVKNKKGAMKITIDNHDDQEAFAELVFLTAYCSNPCNPSKTKLRLVLDEVWFGVANSVLGKNELGAFVHELEISVKPSLSWFGVDDHLRGVFPAPDPPVSQTQIGSSSTAGITAGAMPTFAVSHQSNKTFSKSSTAYSWLPAATTRIENSVTWRWKMNTWEDLTRFNVNRSSSYAKKCGFGALCELPFLSGGLYYNDESFVAEATWEVPMSTIHERSIQQMSIHWEVKVKLHTAHVQRIIFTPLNFVRKCRVTKGEFEFVLPAEVQCKIERA